MLVNLLFPLQQTDKHNKRKIIKQNEKKKNKISLSLFCGLRPMLMMMMMLAGNNTEATTTTNRSKFTARSAAPAASNFGSPVSLSLLGSGKCTRAAARLCTAAAAIVLVHKHNKFDRNCNQFCSETLGISFGWLLVVVVVVVHVIIADYDFCFFSCSSGCYDHFFSNCLCVWWWRERNITTRTTPRTRTTTTISFELFLFLSYGRCFATALPLLADIRGDTILAARGATASDKQHLHKHEIEMDNNTKVKQLKSKSM